MKKYKSSFVLQQALERILDGKCRYACAAIQDVETELRWSIDEDVKSNALKVFQQFKPAHINEGRKNLQEWWPVGDVARIEALKNAVEKALKQND